MNIEFNQFKIITGDYLHIVSLTNYTPDYKITWFESDMFKQLWRDLMDRNTAIVLIVLIIAIVAIVAIFAWIWMYTPYMGGYHGYYDNNTGHGMMHGY
jgi:hypothetical protein